MTSSRRRRSSTAAGVFRRFRSVVLPLTVPALIAVVILSFQGSWNEFTHFLVATNDPDLATLNLGIARLIGRRSRPGPAVPAEAGPGDPVGPPDRHRVRVLQPLLHPVDRHHRAEVNFNRSRLRP